MEEPCAEEGGADYEFCAEAEPQRHQSAVKDHADQKYERQTKTVTRHGGYKKRPFGIAHAVERLAHHHCDGEEQLCRAADD